MSDISDIRQEYTKSSISIEETASNPFSQFKNWFHDALKSDNFYDPTAFTLSTCGNDMIPHSRIVLLKGYDNDGFTFFTNYNSKKGTNILENENVSMLFFWDRLERQIRINGKAKILNKQQSDEYFNSRPYESKIGAIASNQSQILKSKSELEKRVTELEKEYPNNPKRPENWGGYLINPYYFEFWQGRKSRLHDRIVFELKDSHWDKYMLSP